MKKIVIGLLVLLLYAFPPKVYAAQTATVHILRFDQEGQNYWYESSIPLGEDMTKGQIGAALFQALFSHEFEDAYGFPQGTEVLSVSIKEDCLILNVSKEISNYGGGSYLENALKSQIIKTALGIEGIDKVTLFVDNGKDTLPEGSILKEVTKWPEMTEDEMTN